MRIGQGWDIHRLKEGRDLMIGGIKIPSNTGEDAHSDGDVLLHAIIDALYGAFALGDIGSHFPPSDNQYKDISSSDLLKKTLEETKPDIVNLDCTVILEKTRLRPYIDRIRENLSLLLDIDVSRISVKAKTNEALDSLGRGEAIEASCVILINN